MNTTGITNDVSMTIHVMTSSSPVDHVSKTMTVTPTSVATFFNFLESEFLTTSTFTYNKFVAYAIYRVAGETSDKQLFLKSQNQPNKASVVVSGGKVQISFETAATPICEEGIVPNVLLGADGKTYSLLSKYNVAAAIQTIVLEKF